MSAYTKDPEFGFDLWPDFLPGPPPRQDCLVVATLVAWALVLYIVLR